jgi:hypothetical protein
MTSTSDGITRRLQSKGRIELAADDTGVTFVEPGGYFILETAGRMRSDFERAGFFVALASKPHLDARSRQAAVALAQAIGSDFERGRALFALLPSGQAATTR